MNKKSNRNLLLFATIILIISLVFTFAACNKDDNPESDNSGNTTPTLAAATVNDTVTNGSFYETQSGDSYPMTPKTWTSTAASTTGDKKTPASSADVMHGVVSLWEYSYNQNSGNWDALLNPGLQAKANVEQGDAWGKVPAENDYNVLMIYNKYNDSYSDYVTAEDAEDKFMPKGTAYYYKNSSITLTQGRYYRLSVAVYTTGNDSAYLSGDDNKGAYINLNAGGNYSFYSVNTNATWQTYEFYILAAPTANTSATLTLGLGYGAADSGYMTQGYAFFDTVRLDTITAKEYADATAGEKIVKADLSVVNGDFADAITYTSSTTNSAPIGYTSQRASALKDDTATDSQITASYTHYGTVDASANGSEFIKGLFADENNFKTPVDVSDGVLASLAAGNGSDSVLMILNKQKTSTNYTQGNAAGIVTSNKLTVPVGKVVRVSIDVFTYIVNEDAATNHVRGVALKLKGDNDDNELSSIVKNDSDDPADWTLINTNGTWKTYSFYIVGSDYEAAEYTFEMWFGLGALGEEDYHVAGAAFFDNLTCVALSDADANTIRNQVIGSTDETILNAKNIIKGSEMTKVLPANVTNLIANGDFTGTISDSWDFGIAGTIDNDDNAVVAKENVDYKAGVITKAVATNAETLVSEWKMSEEDAAKVGVPFETADQLYAIALFNDSAYELNMKEDAYVTIKKNCYYKLSIYVKTIGIKEGSGLTISLKKKDDSSALLSFTNVNTSSYSHYLYNDYCKYTFYVEGDYLDESKVYLTITFGEGSRVSTDKFLSGYAFISSIMMTTVDGSEYPSSDSTYTVRKSAAINRGNVANGLFYKFDTKNTEYDTATGELTAKPGKVVDWTLSSDTSKIEDKVTSGIVNVNDATLMNNLGLGTANEVYNAWYSANDGALTTGDAVIGDGKPSFLYIKADETGIAPIYYTYTYSSLSESTYYIFYVDVKTVGDSKASVYFNTTNTVDSDIYFTEINTRENGVDKWTRFAIGYDVGMTASVPVKISLYLGASEKAPAGTVKKSDDDPDYNAENAFIKAGDAVMFDNVHYVSFTDKAKYEAALAVFADNYAADTALNAQQNLSASDTFTTDGFETSGTTASGAVFASVNSSNLTGSYATDAPQTTTDSDGNQNNVVMGVLPKDVDDDKLAKVGFGEILEEKDEEENVTTKVNYTNKLTKADVEILFGAAAENVDLGDQVIIINNRFATAYSYTMAKSYSFAAGAYYEASIWVATYGIEEGKGAFVTLTAGTNGETQTYSAINPEKATDAGLYSVSKWQKYSFYIKNGTESALSGSKVTFGLGAAEEANYVQGIAFFDNLTFRKITEAEYNAHATDVPETQVDENGKRKGQDYEYVYNEAESKYVKAAGDTVIGTAWLLDYKPAEKADETTDDNTDENTDNSNTNSKADFDWQYFSYIAISLVLVLAVVIVIIQRYAPKRKRSKETTATKTYSRNATAPKTDNKSTRMKEFDEHKDDSLLNRSNKKKKK